MIVRQAAVVCPQHHYSIGNWRGQNLLQLASIYRPTKYPLPVSVTNSALPCLAAPSFVYPLLPPIAIHHPYHTTSRWPAKNPSSQDPSCYVITTVPRSPPDHSGLRSESSYLLGDIRLHPRVPFRKQEADPTECWTSIPKSERRTHQTPDTPNF